MEEIIYKILKVEARAKKIISEAQENNKTSENELYARLNKLKTEFEEKERQTLYDLRREQQRETETLIDEIKKRTKLQTEKLLSKSELEKNKWTEEIFSSIFAD